MVRRLWVHRLTVVGSDYFPAPVFGSELDAAAWRCLSCGVVPIWGRYVSFNITASFIAIFPASTSDVCYNICYTMRH